jgi:hypothetical protein
MENDRILVLAHLWHQHVFCHNLYFVGVCGCLGMSWVVLVRSCSQTQRGVLLCTWARWWKAGVRVGGWTVWGRVVLPSAHQGGAVTCTPEGSLMCFLSPTGNISLLHTNCFNFTCHNLGQFLKVSQNWALLLIWKIQAKKEFKFCLVLYWLVLWVLLTVQ